MSGWQNTPATALLILADGTRLEGRGIGAQRRLRVNDRVGQACVGLRVGLAGVHLGRAQQFGPAAAGVGPRGRAQRRVDYQCPAQPLAVARRHAALQGRDEVEDDDAVVAARLVLVRAGDGSPASVRKAVAAA